jgi:CysZ protein
MWQDALDSLNDVFSAPFRGAMLKSVGLTLATLALGGVALAKLALLYLVFASGWLAWLVSVAVGLGVAAAAVFLVAPVASLIASFFFDEVAELVEREIDPSAAPGRAPTLADSLAPSLKYGALAIGVSVAGLVLIFVPVFGFAIWFAANAFVLGAQYFELAAMRFRSAPEAHAMRRHFGGTVFINGLIVAGFVSVPVLNLATPLFAAALMARLHKRLSRRAVSPARDARPSSGAVG